MSSGIPTTLNATVLRDVQTAIRDKHLAWTAGKTFFYDFDVKRLQKLFGYKPHDTERKVGNRLRKRYRKVPTEPLPPLPHRKPAAGIDWTDVQGLSYIDPIRNQGLSPICVAYGVVAAIEANARIKEKLPLQHPDHFAFPNLSEEQLFECGNPVKHPKGWNITEALGYCRDVGLVPEYEAFLLLVNLSKKINPDLSRQVTKIGRQVKFDASQTREMKHWLSSRGPLIATLLFPINLDLLFYRRGIYEPTTSIFIPGVSHCVTIIGYDERKKAWKIKNSWGTDWGEAGYMWIKYHSCYLESEVFGVDDLTVYLRKLT